MYLIDTNICIYLINKSNENVQKKIELFDPFMISVSSITVAELEYGIAKSRHIERNRNALRSFLSCFEIIPFDDQDAEQFGAIRAYLEKRGEIIGPFDMQIAAQAIAKEMTVVTNNVREFERVPNLKVENWV